MQSSHINPEVSYVAFVYEADEFCNLVLKNSFLDHIHKVQRCHQSFTVCYIINKLTPYINSRFDKLHICLQFSRVIAKVFFIHLPSLLVIQFPNVIFWSFREQKHYKNPSDLSDCQRPPVEEVYNYSNMNTG